MVSVFGLLDRYIGPAMKRALAVELYEKGMSEEKIANILGVSRSLVSRYLKGNRGSHLEELPRSLLEEIKFIAVEASSGKLQSSDIEYLLWVTALKYASRKKLCAFHAKIDSKIDARTCQLCVKLFSS